MDSFGTRSTLSVGGQDYEIFRLPSIPDVDVSKLPFSLRVLLENLLRCEDGSAVTAEDIKILATWDPASPPDREIAFMPARVLLQDFTGVPAMVDLAAMRDAMARLGADPAKINPLQPAEMVIDHSVQVDAYGTDQALDINAELEFERNLERYAFLRWGQTAFKNFKVVPPDTGIVHQVNCEYLARVVFDNPRDGQPTQLYPDTLVGTDSHTTMVNGLGVLGWGVGGIEAEAALLGQPLSMLIPRVVGFKLSGELKEGSTATDLVLTVTQMLRAKGVVGKFVEFYGPGLANLSIADRATIANMAPEYGATCGIFPVDQQTLNYMRLTGRSEEQITLVEAYCREQGLFHEATTPEAVYSDTLSLELADVVPSVAGPKRPQDRVLLTEAKQSFEAALATLTAAPKSTPIQLAVAAVASAVQSVASAVSTAAGNVAASVASAPVHATAEEEEADNEGMRPATSALTALQAEESLKNGSVVIAAITSCTNTSNPSVMLAAGLLAKKAVAKGLRSKPWVKTSLAPGSKVVTEYYKRAGLTESLESLGFHTVGYGCTTCIGNSGPLAEEVTHAIEKNSLVVVSVLSGNRNFEGRINSEVKANYLMSPPLVVAYALAGRMDIDLYNEPLGMGSDGVPVYLKDIWPTNSEVQETVESALDAKMFTDTYGNAFDGDAHWQNLVIPTGERFTWQPNSTYVKEPPYFVGLTKNAPETVSEISGARVLLVLGHSITTDHISPAGSIKVNQPAGQYLIEHGVAPKDFNSYGSRRGNHEVMVRGTFANVRLRNQLAPGTEGGFTTYLPTGEVMSIFNASALYQGDKTPLIILAGKEYGSGSSRDWAAKGPRLLGVNAVIAESYERIHRSNLVGMGILPLQFEASETAETLGLTGHETFDILGLTDGIASSFTNGRKLTVRATRDGKLTEFSTVVRIDTDQEVQYYKNGGILQYVLRSLLD